MGDVSMRRSALAHLASAAVSPKAASGRLSIRPAERRGYLRLRLSPDDTALLADLQRVLGATLPVIPNTICALAHGVACWLGPDEWIIEVPEEKVFSLQHRLEKCIADRFAAITDLTDAYFALTLEGSAACDVLRKGCSMDVHGDSFKTGHCAQTMLSKADILLVCLEPGERYTIVVDRSYAHYLWCWLVDASLEFGLDSPSEIAH